MYFVLSRGKTLHLESENPKVCLKHRDQNDYTLQRLLYSLKEWKRLMAVDRAKQFSHAVDYFLSELKKAQRCRRNPYSPLKSF